MRLSHNSKDASLPHSFMAVYKSLSLLGFNSNAVALVNRVEHSSLSTHILNSKGVLVILGVPITKSMFVLRHLAIFFGSDGFPKLDFF